MKKKPVFVGAYLVLTSLSLIPAQALDGDMPRIDAGSAEQWQVAQTQKPAKPTVLPGQATGGSSVAPLTEQECKDLGGEVGSTVGVCLSDSACKTKGEDGKIHLVCISKK